MNFKIPFFSKKSTLTEQSLSNKSAVSINFFQTENREGMDKAFIPQFLYKPPFGYPRRTDLVNMRRLAKCPFVEIVVSSVIDKLCAIDGKVVPKNPDANPESDKILKSRIDHVQALFDNPNNNKEDFYNIRRKYLRDMLVLDSGIIQKIFNKKGELTQLMARDGISFNKNPDIHGMFNNKDDIIYVQEFQSQNSDSLAPLNNLSKNNPSFNTNVMQLSDRAAYFQYSYVTAERPVPFGRKEIVWFEMRPQTESPYGLSPMEVLLKTVQLLVWNIDHELEFYNENALPKGVISLDGVDQPTLESFREQFIESMRVKDEFGQWRNNWHKVPIVNKPTNFTRFNLTPQELDFVAQQKWFSKLVWAVFGVTPSSIGFTEDAKGMSNQIVQSKEARDRIINPILRQEEYRINSEIVKEFGYDDVEWKFDMFDVDTERSKYELYELQVRSGLRKINEIRNVEGLDPLDWGDDPPRSYKQQEVNPESVGSSKKRMMDENVMDKEKRMKQNKESQEKSVVIESKPFADYSSFDDCVKKNKNKIDPEAYCATIMRKVEKAQTEESVLRMKEGERLEGEKKLKKELNNFLTEVKKKILVLVDEKKDILNQVKSVEEKAVIDVIDKIKSFFGIDALKGLVNEIVKNHFFKGLESAEKELDMNVRYNDRALTFLQDYTFDNVKGMTNELADDLRQELQRGLMNREGTTKIKERIEKVFDSGSTRAEAIARTEINRAENFGNLEGFKSSGIKGARKYLVITYDDRTSDISKAMGRKYGDRKSSIPIDAEFSAVVGGREFSGQSPPFHVNERDKMIVFVPEDGEKFGD